jgi:N-methylhydantoinase A
MSEGDAAGALRGRRDAWSAVGRGFAAFAVYRRDLLRPGMTFHGPCLVEEESATTVIDAGARVTIDRYGSLDITLGTE